MKKISFLFAIALFFIINLYSQVPKFQSFMLNNTTKELIVVDSIAVETFLNNMLFSGNIEISNISYTGNIQTIGYFSDTENSSGLDCGVVISTGIVDDINNPSSYFANTSHSLPGDDSLSVYINGTTHDAIIIEFDVIIQDSLLLCSEYVFASEEYPEYANSSYNDLFGFFISGPNPDGGVYSNFNMSKVPGTLLPVAINNINNGSSNSGPCMNCEFYINNSNSTNQYFAFDGMTTVLPSSIAVVPDATYHVRLAVSDVGDGIYDSSVLLRIFSFSQPLDTMFFTYDYEIISNNPFMVQFNANMGGKTVNKYFWDFGDGSFSFDEAPIHTYSSATHYPVKLFATNSSEKGVYGKIIAPQEPNAISESGISVLNCRQTADEFVITFEKELQNANIELFSIDGKRIFSSKLSNAKVCYLPIRSLVCGMYMIQISAENQIWKEKFVK